MRKFRKFVNVAAILFVLVLAIPYQALAAASEAAGAAGGSGAAAGAGALAGLRTGTIALGAVIGAAVVIAVASTTSGGETTTTHTHGGTAAPHSSTNPAH